MARPTWPPKPPRPSKAEPEAGADLAVDDDLFVPTEPGRTSGRRPVASPADDDHDLFVRDPGPDDEPEEPDDTVAEGAGPDRGAGPDEDADLEDAAADVRADTEDAAAAVEPDDDEDVRVGPVVAEREAYPTPDEWAPTSRRSGRTARPPRQPREVATSRTARTLAFAGLLVPVVVHAVGAVQRRWLQEDGFINIRVAQQVAAGNGPVYNVGERVEAFTSPLWLGLLVALRGLTFGQVGYEWLAVGAGIVLALAGTVGLLVGAVALWTPLDRRPGDAWWLPVGALALVSLSATWDFSSSGLETGLALAWVGGSFAAVARVLRAAATRDRDRDQAAAARAARGPFTSASPERGGTARAVPRRVRLLPVLALVGLGPLVRPELGLYAVAFAAVLVVNGWWPVRAERRQVPRWWALLLAFAAVPVAYQVFRMGYYATLVPNTALAKNAARSSWDRGVDYLANFVGPYRLVLPGLLVAIALGVAYRGFPRRDQRGLLVALVAPAVLHGLYVVWIGGDYMHGRFWVVPLAALLAPLAAVPVPRGWASRPGRAESIVRLAGAGVVAVWAVAAIGWMRPPEQSGSVVDQRAVIVAVARSSHPIRLGEQPAPFPAFGGALRAAAGTDEYLDTDEGRLLLWAGDASEAAIEAKGPDVLGQTTTALPREEGGLVIRYDGLGMVGVAAGLDVTIIDNFGLADPIASRLPVESSYAAGHTRQLPVPWRRARVGLPGADAPGSEDAAAALACGALRDYLDDIHADLTPGRFLGNVFAAPGNTTLRVPGDPAEARDRFC